MRKNERFSKIVNGVEYKVNISINGKKGSYKYNGYKIENDLEDRVDGFHLTQKSVWVEYGEGQFTVNDMSVKKLSNELVMDKLKQWGISIN
jgi:hypothetical protein